MIRRRTCVPLVALVTLAVPSLFAQPSGDDFFEQKIRPVLASSCFTCHSSQLKVPMGGLVLDTKSGLQTGGASGPVVIPGKPSESRLLRALSYTDSHLQMPPTGKLPDNVIADFESWIASGAPDPRVDGQDAADNKPLKGMPIEEGRGWWSFQPVESLPTPEVKNREWPRSKVDSFILAKLEHSDLAPSAEADKRTLILRAYLDLTGLKPTFEEIESFVRNPSPDAYEDLIDRLLQSKHYGERWGRYWLDVARYAEDNTTSEATNPPYLYAWRYRDWVIEAMNQDMPYNRFVQMQLAADLMHGTTRQDWRALGYLGTALVYHKEPRLSQEVLATFTADDWDERVDALSRGVLGLTVACARCHDHKFDPIETKDYYAMAGVFASTMRAERPMREDLDPQLETRYLWVAQRLFDLNVMTGILADLDKQTDPEAAARKLAAMKAEMRDLYAEIGPSIAAYPELVEKLARFAPEDESAQPPPAADAPARRRSRRVLTSDAPFINAVYDAALYVDGADPYMTEMDYRPGEARDLPVFKGGNVATPGEVVPRRFLTVLSKDQSPFRQGSGRLELAEKIFADAAPLAARVIVNRVWGWHFGQPLVETPSNFGTQGQKPSHPELLDDLAARFMANGWSLKWLHRELMLSSTYRQSSHPREDGAQADETNRLLWRMNPRRLDIEAFRDSILQSADTLDETMYGPSADLDEEGNHRRTVYARVSRGRLNTVLHLYDFPDPTQTSPGRDLTTTPLQQLFVMNSRFIQDQAAALAQAVAGEATESDRIRGLYRRILIRNPSPLEIDRASSYLAQASLADFAQALLASNEEIFWP